MLATRPRVRWLHHIPNGVVMGSEKLAGMLKAEGLTKGVLDYFLPVGRPLQDNEWPPKRGVHTYLGLYIELKADGCQGKKNGGMSEDQVDFAKAVVSEGYLVVLVYDWHEAKAAVEAYLDGKAIPHLWSPPA